MVCEVGSDGDKWCRTRAEGPNQPQLVCREMGPPRACERGQRRWDVPPWRTEPYRENRMTRGRHAAMGGGLVCAARAWCVERRRGTQEWFELRRQWTDASCHDSAGTDERTMSIPRVKGCAPCFPGGGGPADRRGGGGWWWLWRLTCSSCMRLCLGGCWQRQSKVAPGAEAGSLVGSQMAPKLGKMLKFEGARPSPAEHGLVLHTTLDCAVTAGRIRTRSWCVV